MEGGRRSMIVAVAVVVALLAGCLAVGEAFSCSTVSGDLSQCLTYLEGGAGPSQSCCSGVSSLYTVTKPSRPDRIAACNCIKNLASALGSKLKQTSVSALPGKCGVNLGYSISISTNCAGIP